MFTKAALLRLRFCALLFLLSIGAAAQPLAPAQPADWQRTISIDCLNFSPKIKRISDARKQQLMDSGRQGAQAFFKK
ncbi:hypothetical protein [Hymenobacter antarcticus]|uniref:Uncharacterized protein n=1 Tax=Hymenobacter antarcticus TaxID=486270 RepID=A0ABP7QFL9_9BACT